MTEPREQNVTGLEDLPGQDLVKTLLASPERFAELDQKTADKLQRIGQALALGITAFKASKELWDSIPEEQKQQLREFRNRLVEKIKQKIYPTTKEVITEDAEKEQPAASPSPAPEPVSPATTLPESEPVPTIPGEPPAVAPPVAHTSVAEEPRTPPIDVPGTSVVEESQAPTRETKEPEFSDEVRDKISKLREIIQKGGLEGAIQLVKETYRYINLAELSDDDLKARITEYQQEQMSITQAQTELSAVSESAMPEKANVARVLEVIEATIKDQLKTMLDVKAEREKAAAPAPPATEPVSPPSPAPAPAPSAEPKPELKPIPIKKSFFERVKEAKAARAARLPQEIEKQINDLKEKNELTDEKLAEILLRHALEQVEKRHVSLLGKTLDSRLVRWGSMVAAGVATSSVLNSLVRAWIISHEYGTLAATAAGGLGGGAVGALVGGGVGYISGYRRGYREALNVATVAQEITAVKEAKLGIDEVAVNGMIEKIKTQQLTDDEKTAILGIGVMLREGQVFARDRNDRESIKRLEHLYLVFRTEQDKERVLSENKDLIEQAKADPKKLNEALATIAAKVIKAQANEEAQVRINGLISSAKSEAGNKAKSTALKGVLIGAGFGAIFGAISGYKIGSANEMLQAAQAKFDAAKDRFQELQDKLAELFKEKKSLLEANVTGDNLGLGEGAIDPVQALDNASKINRLGEIFEALKSDQQIAPELHKFLGEKGVNLGLQLQNGQTMAEFAREMLKIQNVPEQSMKDALYHLLSMGQNLSQEQLSQILTREGVEHLAHTNWIAGLDGSTADKFIQEGSEKSFKHWLANHNWDVTKIDQLIDRVQTIDGNINAAETALRDVVSDRDLAEKTLALRQENFRIADLFAPKVAAVAGGLEAAAGAAAVYTIDRDLPNPLRALARMVKSRFERPPKDSEVNAERKPTTEQPAEELFDLLGDEVTHFQNLSDEQRKSFWNRAASRYNQAIDKTPYWVPDGKVYQLEKVNPADFAKTPKLKFKAVELSNDNLTTADRIQEKPINESSNWLRQMRLKTEQQVKNLLKIKKEA